MLSGNVGYELSRKPSQTFEMPEMSISNIQEVEKTVLSAAPENMQMEEVERAEFNEVSCGADSSVKSPKDFIVSGKISLGKR